MAAILRTIAIGFFILFVLSSGAQTNDICIAGNDTNCLFPCPCKSGEIALNGQDVKDACDRHTGNCISGKCLDGFHLFEIGNGVKICQPGHFHYPEYDKYGPVTLTQLNASIFLLSNGHRKTENVASDDGFDCQTFIQNHELIEMEVR